MRTTISTSAIAITAVLLASPASAADLGGSTKDAPVNYGVAEGRPITWSGIYGGAAISYGTTTLGTDGDQGGISADGPGFGGRIGADLQRGPIVFGILGDFNYFDQKLELFGTEFASKDWGWDLMGRIGFTGFDNAVLFYGVGGYGQDEFSAACKGCEATIATWKLGAGIEGQLRPNLTLGLEYIHDFHDADDIVKGLEDVADLNGNSVWLRMNYKFNGYTFGN
jgi:opacity protein-like surface antigen